MLVAVGVSGEDWVWSVDVGVQMRRLCWLHCCVVMWRVRLVLRDSRIEGREREGPAAGIGTLRMDLVAELVVEVVYLYS